MQEVGVKDCRRVTDLELLVILLWIQTIHMDQLEQQHRVCCWAPGLLQNLQFLLFISFFFFFCLLFPAFLFIFFCFQPGNNLLAGLKSRILLEPALSSRGIFN